MPKTNWHNDQVFKLHSETQIHKILFNKRQRILANPQNGEAGIGES